MELLIESAISIVCERNKSLVHNSSKGSDDRLHS